jgi:hypothetical protein
MHAAISHWPAVQLAAATSFAEPPHVLALHALPQAPQLPLSVLVFVEQFVPSPGQLAQGALQLAATHVYTPPTSSQAGVPFCVVHTRPHCPQFSTVLRGVLQFVPSPGQLPQPGLHAPISHVPPTHTGVPFWVVHTWPQAPQLFTSLPPMKVKQLLPLPGQAAYPMLQLPTAHVGGFVDVLHAGVPFCVVQTVPHAPQLLVVLVGVSHPLDGLWSQSA